MNRLFIGATSSPILATKALSIIAVLTTLTAVQVGCGLRANSQAVELLGTVKRFVHGYEQRHAPDAENSDGEIRLLQDAIAACDESLRLDPNLAPAYGFRGLANYYLGNLDDALKDLSKSIELRPEDRWSQEFYVYRSWVYERMGKQQQADSDVKKARHLLFRP